MKIIESYLTKNRTYTAPKRIVPKGIMLHSVGCSQPAASVFIRQFNSPTKSVSVHAFIDGRTGDVHQTLPWTNKANHCGSTANNTHISVEMCEPAQIKYVSGSRFTVSDAKKADACAVVHRTHASAVELFAFLCKEYNLDPLADGVIISHSEGHKRGVASDHGDPEHLWRGLGLAYTMDDFRKAVKERMSGKAPDFVKMEDVPFLWQTRKTAPIFLLPDKPEVRKTSAGIGVYTIVNVKGNYGLLKSYRDKADGWVYLPDGKFLRKV